jgi:hypothetical protein
VRLLVTLQALIIQLIRVNHAVQVVRPASDYPVIVLPVLIIIIGYHQIILAHQPVQMDSLQTHRPIIAIHVMYNVQPVQDHPTVNVLPAPTIQEPFIY